LEELEELAGLEGLSGLKNLAGIKKIAGRGKAFGLKCSEKEKQYFTLDVKSLKKRLTLIKLKSLHHF
jgi:hypothetical protein